MDLTEIGWTGKAHGLRGEIKLRILEHYEEDFLSVTSVLIGEPPIPYFLESVRGGGAIIVKFEGLDTREQVSLLSNKALYALSSQVSEREPEPDTPFDALIGWSIEAQGYPTLGPIEGIMDLPEHYLAELKHDGKDILIPLHENLITDVKEADKVLVMDLPGGLLDMD